MSKTDETPTKKKRVSLADRLRRRRRTDVPVEGDQEGSGATALDAEPPDSPDFNSTFAEHAHLDVLRPKEAYVFRSDHWEVDDQFACILTFIHKGGAPEDYGVFWGVNMIPSGLDQSVTTVVLAQHSAWTKKQVDSKLEDAERLAKMQRIESSGKSTTLAEQMKNNKSERDRLEVYQDLLAGGKYMDVTLRLMVKASSLELMDESIAQIKRSYTDRFVTLEVYPELGQQRQELTSLFHQSRSATKTGKPFGFTTSEFAGFYPLVTQGLNDPTGHYVGRTVGDVNSSSEIFDPNLFRHHVTVCDPVHNDTLDRQTVSAMWASKISQQALMDNHRVVHLVLDETDLDKVGPKFTNLTTRVDMSNGEVNMLEMFGEHEDELSIFPTHLNKLALMTHQLYPATDTDRIMMESLFKEVLQRFYVDQRMWANNPQENREKLRVVGIPHREVPRLEILVAYLNQAYQKQVTAVSKDHKVQEATGLLAKIYADILNTNGDLFNQHTSDSFDAVSGARRVVYDFSSLNRRGAKLAMAQLVNVVDFAVSALTKGDVVIIHGAERIIDPGVREYLDTCLTQLYRRGGRVVWVYESVERLLEDRDYVKLDAADYSIWGTMRPTLVDKYVEAIGAEIPNALRNLIVTDGAEYTYLRRGSANVVFHRDLSLGVNSQRVSRRTLGSLGTDGFIHERGRTLPQGPDAKSEGTQETPQQQPDPVSSSQPRRARRRGQSRPRRRRLTTVETD